MMFIRKDQRFYGSDAASLAEMYNHKLKEKKQPSAINIFYGNILPYKIPTKMRSLPRPIQQSE